MTMENTIQGNWYNDDLMHEMSRMKVSPKIKSAKALYTMAKKDLLRKYPTMHLYLEGLCIDSDTTEGRMSKRLISNYIKAYSNYLKISKTGEGLTISFFDTEGVVHKKGLIFMKDLDWLQLIGCRLYGIDWYLYWID